MQHQQQLASADWLLEHLHDSDIRIYDATYHMPAAKRNASEEFFEKHIPHAHFFDIDAVADPGATLPHMLPNSNTFAAAVEATGMRDEFLAIVYDTHGLMSAARLWWMFRIFGHDQVAVLDGGLPAWLAAGGALESGAAEKVPSPQGSFKRQFRPELVRSKDEVIAAIHSDNALIIDARGTPRFRGQVPEPRAGVRSGHIPGSISVPYTQLLDEHALLLRPVALETRFRENGFEPDLPIIASCGSGVTACVLALALAELGRTDVAVYDGSWNEWGADEDLPIETLAV